MRKVFFVIAMLALAALGARADNIPIILVQSAPSGACTNGQPMQLVIPTGVLYSCQAGTWGVVGAGAGGPPTGSAGGDLSGTYPNPAVAGIKSVPFCTGYTPTNGQSVVLTTASSPNPCYTAVANLPVGGGTMTGALNGTTITGAVIGGTYDISGFTQANYPGIYQSAVAWSSGHESPVCQVASYSGNYYIAAANANGSVTPGTNGAEWYPDPSNSSSAATPADCAWAVAYGATVAASGQYGYKIKFGTNYYPQQHEWAEPTTTNGTGVSIEGNGIEATHIIATSSLGSNPMLLAPAQSGNLTSIEMQSFVLDVNGYATACGDFIGVINSEFRYLNCYGNGTGNDHDWEFGSSGYDAQELSVSQVFASGQGGAGQGTPSSWAQLSVSLSGGIPTIAVTSGGAGYPISSTTYPVILNGTQGGTSDSPCSTMGTTTATTNSSGVVTSVTSTASGCSGTVYAVTAGGNGPIYGFRLYASDSTFIDLVPTSVTVGIDDEYDGSNTFIHAHPTNTQIGVRLSQGSGGNWIGTELDTISQYGFDFQQTSHVYATPSIVGTRGVTILANASPGTATYHWGQAIAGNRPPVKISASGDLCSGSGGSNVPIGYNEMLLSSGPITSFVVTPPPSGSTVAGNDTSCVGATLGDYINGDVSAGATVVPIGWYDPRASQFTGADMCARTNSAIAAMPTVGGYPSGVVSWLGYAGTQACAATVTVNSPYVSILGPGSTTLLVTCPTGDCLRIETSPYVGTGSITTAGRFSGFQLNVPASGNAVHIGDINGVTFDDVSINCSSAASSVGFWFDDITQQTERTEILGGSVYKCAKNFRFTNESGNGSFYYNRFLDVRQNIGVNGIGFSFEGDGPNRSTIASLINMNDPTGTVLSATSTALTNQNNYSITAECSACGSKGTLVSVDATSSVTGFGQITGANQFYNLITAGGIYQIGSLATAGTNNAGDISEGFTSADDHTIYLDPTPTYVTSAQSFVKFFGATSTSGNARFSIYKPNGSGNTEEFAVDAQTGNIFIKGNQIASIPDADPTSLALGPFALASQNSTGLYNIGVGNYAGTGITSGPNNVFIGQYAGGSMTTGARNVAIAPNAAGNGNYSDTISIGYNTQPSSNSQTTIGSAGHTALLGPGPALTSATTIASSSFLTTGLVMQTVPTSTTMHGHCALTWEQTTGTATVSFGAGMSNAPTDLFITSVVNTSAAGATAVAYNTQTATTATIIGGAATPGVASTPYYAHFDFTLQVGGTNAVTLTFYGLTSNTSDALVIEPGSYCSWLP